MTCYAIDTEFIDDGKTIDLISIAIVGSDGLEYYAQSVEFDHRNASSWVKENVLSHLSICPWANVTTEGVTGLYRTDKAYHRRYGQCVDQQRGRIHNCPWRTRKQIAQEITAFINASEGKPEFIGWITSYDYVALCQLFGTMLDAPAGWPHYIRDIQPLLDDLDISDEELPMPEGTNHNALDDARHIQRLWDYVQQKRQREALAEITRLAQEMGDYD